MLNDVILNTTDDIVMTYEKGLEVAMQYLDSNVKHGDMKNFCQEHNISHPAISAIRSAYKKGDISQVPYQPTVISDILNIIGLKHSVEKPKPKSYFVLNTESKIQFFMNEEEIKKLTAQFQRLNLVEFAKSFGFKVDEIATQKIRKGISVNEVTEMYHNSRRDDIILVTKYATSEIYIYHNPNDSLDKGSIFNFVRSRVNSKWANEQTTFQIIQEWMSDNKILLEATPASGAQTVQDMDEKEMIAYRALLMKNYFELTPLEDRTVLKQRGISDETIDHPCFHGTVFNKPVFDKEGNLLFNNVAFPIYDLDDNGFYVIGIEEVNKEFHNPLGKFYERGSEKMAFTDLGFWFSLPYFKKFKFDDENLQPDAHAFIGETAQDCMAYLELHAHELQGNYFFISCSGAYDMAGQPEKLRKLQEYLELAGTKTVTLINKNNLEGQIANTLLYAQLYEPAKFVDDQDFGRIKMKSEEQSYTPEVTFHQAGTGKARVVVKVYYPDHPDPNQKILERNKKVFFVRDAFMKYIDPRKLASEYKYTVSPCDSRSMTISLTVDMNMQVIDILQKIVVEIQPEKKKFLKIIRPLGLDFSKDLEEKKKQKLKEQESIKQSQKNAFTLGLDMFGKKS